MYRAFAERVLVILIPLTLLLFVPYLNQNVKDFDFIKKNVIVLIGLLSVAGLSFMPPKLTIFKYFPILQQFPIVVFIIYWRWIFLIVIATTSYFLLYLKRIVK